MKSDYWRYITEFTEGEMKNMAAMKTNNSYQSACKLAEKHLRICNPLYLSLMLNLSVYYYEVLFNEKRATDILQETFDKAIGMMDDVLEEDYKEVTLLMQLMKDNLVLWS
jgi:14-3-3 protein epsilon